jgi:hypothetical protein
VNGLEHYRESERLLDAAKADVRNAPPATEAFNVYRDVYERAAFAVSVAAVHARLAIAAATVDSNPAARAMWDAAAQASAASS